MIFKIILTVLYVIGGLAYIASIGEKREPVTPSLAAANTLISGLVIAGLWLWV